MMTPKTKIAVAVAGGLALLALGYVAIAHNAAANAAAQDNSGGGAFPSLLFSGAAQPAQISPASGSQMQDNGTTAAPDSSTAAINAALSGSVSQITANTSTAYNANATDLFKTLPDILSKAGLQSFNASQQQTPEGATVLSSSVIYKPLAAPSTSPTPPAPTQLAPSIAANIDSNAFGHWTRPKGDASAVWVWDLPHGTQLTI